jgi:hypothetical protein
MSGISLLSRASQKKRPQSAFFTQSAQSSFPPSSPPPLLWPLVAIRSKLGDGFSNPPRPLRFPSLLPRNPPPFPSSLLWRRLIALATSRDAVGPSPLFRLRYLVPNLSTLFSQTYLYAKNGFTNTTGATQRSHRPCLSLSPPGKRKCGSVLSSIIGNEMQRDNGICQITM